MADFSFQQILQFSGENWQSIPLNERFIYTPWTIVAIVYLMLGYYDKLHGNTPIRKVAESNFRYHIYISCIIPYVIFTLFRANGYTLAGEFDLPWLKTLAFAIALIGAFIISMGRVQLDGYWGPDIYHYDDVSKFKLVTHGFYEKTRHPIYFGQWLLVMGTGLSTSNWTFFLGTVIASLVLIIIRASREERRLKELLGSVWEDYYNKTGFFPWNGY